VQFLATSRLFGFFFSELLLQTYTCCMHFDLYSGSFLHSALLKRRFTLEFGLTSWKEWPSLGTEGAPAKSRCGVGLHVEWTRLHVRHECLRVFTFREETVAQNRVFHHHFVLAKGWHCACSHTDAPSPPHPDLRRYCYRLQAHWSMSCFLAHIWGIVSQLLFANP
jgi:hypothetical protein